MKHPFRTFLSTRGDSRSDAELLAAARDDRGAFTELVARHGPLVWSVCRGLLSEADAEDAFQATFLALFRATVRDESALASWLHGAALRVSLALRREAGRRRVRERAVAAPEAAPEHCPDDWADTMATVHREVARLPAADRAAFVLCVLEGLTQSEAAVRLGRTPGAVAGQVARAKQRLVVRLTGRGIVPALAALGTAATVRAVPPGLVARVVDLPPNAVSPKLVNLAKGGSGMNAPSVKVIAAAVVGVAILAAGVLATTETPPAPPLAAATDTGTPAENPRPKNEPNGPQPVPAPPESGIDPTDGEPLDKPPTKRTFTGHKSSVTSLAFTSDGKTLVAAGGGEKTVRLWNMADGTSTAWPEHSGYVRATVLTRDGATAAVACADGAVYIRAFPSGKELHSFKLDGDVCGVAFSPDGKTLAAAGFGDTIPLWTVADGKPAGGLTVKGDKWGRAPGEVLFSADGRRLFATYVGVEVAGFVCVWDTEKCERVATLGAVKAGCMTLDANARRLAVGGGFEDRVEVYDVADGFKRLRQVRFDEKHCRCLALCPDGKLLATVSANQGNKSPAIVRVWDVDTGKKLRSWKAHNVWATAAAFSPDGKTLATGGDDKLIHLWDVPTAEK
ncbi:(myosin heavy-chain) kinase : Uncultured bacterium genome assembly Metasoil_fosmids_resub OS=uncultured bacterium PE=4 SV=1: Sigma70_r2: Sigma70_r4_2: WD40: WD40: WD40 [Gemmata massiliana]|uniref:ECF RNA polymerase sigma factor SigE n=1 Tax=Gemmata massiliana TaxID=1210884 RepID=A0A6P2D0F5_9BACT|nr:sigma-70 family RNA polymerase sigma factor [Gemmata massiliana]VTR94619.1 (myosin heavy-chain) kinase : Uncultured bacterium genome assembly Metasoil_fosmids_resub OS=uncultured bacterium PE=4 SV=1: Sigma70_r2: Sigma70_r4_2: WD40: WD40: WD40 [Gemmata massiliana]